MPHLSLLPIIPSVAALSRAFLTWGCKSVRVLGTDQFLHILTDPKRAEEGRGIVTYANHISVLDEPIMWGALPSSYFWDRRTVRWSLGASDIIFKNELYRWFFRQGQTLEVFRDRGIYQDAINQAIQHIGRGAWIHIFPEGKVNLTRSTYMRRFKWGISRLILEAPICPYVVPVWLMGFDQIMPHPRAPPRWVPRTGADICVVFGDPIDVDAYRQTYFEWASMHHASRLTIQRSSSSSPALGESVLDTLLALRLPRVDIHTPPHHIYTYDTWRSVQLAPEDHPAYAMIRSHLAAYLRTNLAHVGLQTRLTLGYGPGEGLLAHRPDDVHV